MKIKTIINCLELLAPPSYQESYDNSKLIVGDMNGNVTGVLISLDCTEDVVGEALDKGCNLIVSHHPIVFSGLKSLTGKNYVERTVIKAIKSDIAIYAIHTNLDNVADGVNRKITEIIGLRNVRILAPKKDTLSKLVSFVPTEDTQEVLSALYEAGAGQIGNYDHCSFQGNGTGTFRPNDKANPHIGTSNVEERVDETRIELIFPEHLTHKIIGALNSSHPYEEVAYYLTRLSNTNQEVGSGMIGELPEPMDPMDLLQDLKRKFNLKVVRHTKIHTDSVKKIAVCGGAGSFLLGRAKGARADLFITADYKYHEFFDAEDQIIIADIGHYESEVFTKDLIYDHLKEKFANIALNLSEVNTNPINYL